MKEQRYWHEAKEVQSQVDNSNDQLALRALTTLVFKTVQEYLTIELLMTKLSFHPYSIAKSIAKLESLGIVSMIDGNIVKHSDANLKILKNRFSLLRVSEKPMWKRIDARVFEATRFVLK